MTTLWKGLHNGGLTATGLWPQHQRCTLSRDVKRCQEMEAAEVWAEKNGTERKLVFEEWYPKDDGDANGKPQWASEMEVWGNYELSDGDMVHGSMAANRNWDPSEPDFEAKVHGDGILVFGSVVLISHVPISLALAGVRLSLTQLPFAPCVRRSSKG